MYACKDALGRRKYIRGMLPATAVGTVVGRGLVRPKLYHVVPRVGYA